MNNEMQTRFKETVYRVEATRFEKSVLWRSHSNEAVKHKLSTADHPHLVVDWVQITSGYGLTVGWIEDRSVHVSFEWANINDKLVMFWEPTSFLVDYDIIDKWFEVEMPHVEKCEADTFTHCIDWINKQHKEPDTMSDETPDYKTIVDSIVRDLTGRGGLRQSWDNIDEEIHEEIKDAWAKIIENGMNGKT